VVDGGEPGVDSLFIAGTALSMTPLRFHFTSANRLRSDTEMY